jgi:predicted phage terminase large subunit-like protein
LINVPPRHMKSLLVSVLFPAWVWANAPERRFLSASHSRELAERDSLKMRRLVSSDWYRRRYGKRFRLSGDQNEKGRFENDRTGARIATSVGGGTGEGGDLIIIDDIHRIDDAYSEAALESACEWFGSTISTRENDPASGAIIAVGQRLHESDIFGYLLADDWTHVCLPAEYDPEHLYLCPDDPRREPGELLWPHRFDRAHVEALKRRLGPYGAAGLLQQLPAPASGGMFERKWWNYYNPNGELPSFDKIIQSWDLPFSDKPGSSFAVGQVWGRAGANFYLLRQVRKRMQTPQTLNEIRRLTAWVEERFPRHRAHAKLIEEAAGGHAVIQTLRHEIPGITPVKPDGTKIARADAIAHLIEPNVYLPGARAARGEGCDRVRTPSFAQELINEAAAFPNGRYDDQVDAMAHALRYLNGRRGLKLYSWTPPSRGVSLGHW